MKRKSFTFLLTGAFMCASLAGCGAGSAGTSFDTTASAESSAEKDTAETSKESTQTVKVGCVFPVTGNNADQGVINVDGCQFAVDYINNLGGIQALGGAKLELVVYDNQSDADQSKSVAERLINENPDIAAVTGAASSAFVLPMLPVFEKNQMPFLTAQVSESITNQGYRYSFRFGTTGGDFAAKQVAFLEALNNQYNLGISKIGIVYEDTEWGISNTSGAVNAITASGANGSGLEIAYNKSFQAGSSDLTNIVTGLKSAGYEVVFPTCYTQDAKLLFDTMASMNYHPLIIGGGCGFLYPSFAEALGDTVDGIVSVTGHNCDCATILNNPDIADIGKRFYDKYGYFMSEQSTSAFSAIYLMAQAMEAAGSTEHEAVKNALERIAVTAATPGGEISFDETHANNNAHALIVQWQKGKDTNYTTVTVFPDDEASAEFILPDDLKK